MKQECPENPTKKVRRLCRKVKCVGQPLKQKNMKNIFFTSVICTLIFTNCIGQQNKPVHQITKDDYLNKRFHQNTAAHLMLWGGFAESITGVVISTNDNYEPGFWGGRNNNKYKSAGDIIAITGLVAMAGSIPLFIAASKNKRKAMSVSLKNETTRQLLKENFVTVAVPSLSFKISL
jgi:hypothetical protein